MARAEFKKEKDKYRVSLFHGEKLAKRQKSYYWNIIDKDPNKLAQVLIDLYLDGFPIIEAYKRMRLRLDRKDWVGF